MIEKISEHGFKIKQINQIEDWIVIIAQKPLNK